MSRAESGVRRGRSARRTARLEKSFDSLPALDRGLPYVDVMSPTQLDRMHDATMRILEEKGIEFRDDESAEMWRSAGATVQGHHVRIDRELLLQLISSVPSSYTMHARNPARTVKLGDGHTCFAPAYGSPMVIDLDGNRRNATLEDFNNFAKLAYMAPAMHMTGGVLVEPMDIPVPKRHLHMMYSLLKYSDKPFMGMVLGRDKALDSMAMVKLVFGEDYLESHTVMTSLANGNSPLVWDETMLEAAKVYARHNQAMLYSPFALCGASTPASVVGTMAQISAEALAGVAFSQLCRKGAPAVYGQWLATVSMQSGAPMAGTPEICHINMLMGQLARFYRTAHALQRHVYQCQGLRRSGRFRGGAKHVRSADVRSEFCIVNCRLYGGCDGAELRQVCDRYRTDGNVLPARERARLR